MPEFSSSAPGNALAGSLTGHTIGRFSIGERLGKGGMGEVYRAEDTRLKRTVALKRLSPSLRSDPLYRRRFQEEAERASSLTDPHVAAIYDVIEQDEEILLVMEFVEGKTLRQRLRESMTLEEFLAIAIECAEALVAAHERGIVHCDIKPENIMLAAGTRVKILDFGVAKHLPRSDQSSTIDRSGTVGGTPAYMAPEVLLEKSTDGRADIFSLGIVLYEALGGRHPFMSDSYVATTHRILHETPTPIRVFNNKIPEQLEQVVFRAMAKEPAQRYLTAQDLLDDLRDVQAGVTPSKLLPAVRAVQQNRSTWWLWALGAVLAMMFIALAIESPRVRRWFGAGGPPAQRMQLAILPLTPAADDANSRAFAAGLTETLSMRLTQLTTSYPLQIVPPREIAGDAIQTAEQARRTFGVNLVLEGSVRESSKMVRVSYSLVDAAKLTQLRADTVTVEANKPFEVEDRVLESVVSTLGLTIRPQEKEALFRHGTQEPAAYDYYLRGRGYLQEFDRTENLDSAITVFEHALQTDPNYALAYAGLGEAYLQKYSRDRQQSWIDKASANCQRAVMLANAMANGHICLGMVDNTTGRYEDAVQQFRRAVELDPTSDDASTGLAFAYRQLGRPADAERTFQRAIELRPQYWGGYAWLGGFYLHASRYDDAARMYTEMIALAPDSFQGYSNLGVVYLLQGRYSDAIPQFQRSVAIYPSPDAYSNLGVSYFFQGNFQEAAHNYEKALRVGSNDSSAYLIWGNLGEAYYWTGDRARSAEAYEKAIALAKDRLKVNVRDADVLVHIGLYNAMLQEKATAEEYVDKAMQQAPQDTNVRFNAAKALVELGEGKKAFPLLEKAVAAGYSKPFVRDDPAFKVVATDVQFQHILQGK